MKDALVFASTYDKNPGIRLEAVKSLKNFEITKDQTTSIKIGPPFQVKTTAQRNKDTVVIGCTLVGQAGEQYRPDSRIKRNGRRVSPPILRIIDEAGDVIYSGRFKYG